MNAPPFPDHVSLCKSCKRRISWENLLRFERELQPRVFERCYVCPHCRAVLEFATWQTGVSRKY